MRVRIRSSASLSVPPGKVVEAIVFKLEIMNYELGRTKTANIEDPTFNGNSSAKRVPSLLLPMSSARFPPRVRPAALMLFVSGGLLIVIELAEVRDRET